MFLNRMNIVFLAQHATNTIEIDHYVLYICRYTTPKFYRGRELYIWRFIYEDGNFKNRQSVPGLAQHVYEHSRSNWRTQRSLTRLPIPIGQCYIPVGYGSVPETAESAYRSGMVIYICRVRPGTLCLFLKLPSSFMS